MCIKYIGVCEYNFSHNYYVHKVENVNRYVLDDDISPMETCLIKLIDGINIYPTYKIVIPIRTCQTTTRVTCGSFLY